MKTDDSITLTATVSPSNATNKAVTWKSSNTAIATVSSSGVITGKAIGSATITVASSADNTKSATCSVVVEAEVSAELKRPVRIGNTSLTEFQKFGASRDGGARAHSGVDFAGGFQKNALPTVYAIKNGTVISYRLFWEGTYVLNVQNDDGTVFRYCEITSNLTTGDKVLSGNVIGKVALGNSVRQGKGFVFHLEHYKGTSSGDLGVATVSGGGQIYDYVQAKTYNRRRDLQDPTPIYNLPQW